MNYSENFTLEELIESQAGRRLKIEEQFKPSDAIKENLKKLCVYLLQPIRDGIDKPIKISSGYRCKRVNKAVGGKPTSQHIEGKAADLQAIGYTNAELFNYIKGNHKFDQLIWEYGTKEEPAWVHVSYDNKIMRNQIIYIHG
jgi:hypothetical protein